MALTIDFPYGRANIGYMPSIGARIRRIRKEQGLNQTDLAKACGVDQSMISDYENDSALFSAGILVKMAIALNTSMDAIMLGAEAPDESQLLTWFRACTPEMRQALLLSAKSMAAASPPAEKKEPPRKQRRAA